MQTSAETKAKAKLSKRRPVRSFVIRGRSLTPRQQHAMQHHAKDYLLDLATESAAENKQKLLQQHEGWGKKLYNNTNDGGKNLQHKGRKFCRTHKLRASV